MPEMKYRQSKIEGPKDNWKRYSTEDRVTNAADHIRSTDAAIASIRETTDAKKTGRKPSVAAAFAAYEDPFTRVNRQSRIDAAEKKVRSKPSY